ncbi:MAG: DUF4959 domain-containing protein [Prevotellaceae bacterium]|nr:DUF4959 domain-containing protein [Prevotellaceae bacterium]
MNLFSKMKQIIAVTLLMTAIVSCSEFEFKQVPTDSLPPSPLQGVEIDSIPGGAKVSYVLPDEIDISYVKCEYMLNGVKKTVRASVYNSYLFVEGLGSKAPVDISLYVVDHSENVSEPVTKTFIPGTPPIAIVFSSLKLYADFGGISISWENDFDVEIGFTVFAEAYGEMKEGETKFFKTGGEYTFRGYDDSERKYAVQVRDKWGNVYDILKEDVLAPYYERLLDRHNFIAAFQPGDNNTVSNNRPLALVWDGNRGNLWHTANFQPMPQTVTMDLGVVAKISRFVLWARDEPRFHYGNNTFKTFELWGITALPMDKSEEYWTGDEWKNDWTMLGDYVMHKPSGLPHGQWSAEDTEFARQGFQFAVSSELGAVKYLRFVIKSTWVEPAGTALHMAEFEFYGDDGTKETNKE